MAAAIPEILGAVTEGGAEAGAAEGAAGGAEGAPAPAGGGGGLGKMVKDTLSGGKVGEFLFGAQSLGLKHQGGDGLGTSSDGAADGVRSA